MWRIAHSESSMGWGGQEHRVMAELAGFRRRGHSTWLLAPAGSAIASRATGAGVTVRLIATDKLRFGASVVQIARWLRRERIEVLNTHSSRDGWLAGLAGRLARVPLLVRTRHIDVSYPNRWLSRHAFVWLADHVMTTSEKISAHIREHFGIEPAKVSTIPTGIDLGFFSAEGPRAPLVMGLGEGPKIGMISVLRSWKGHSIFLQAITELKRSGFAGVFIIAGEGPMKELIEGEIRERGLAGNVRLVGHTEDVAGVLRGLDVLVIASTKHEGVPQIGLQALATKTAVVGSDAGGIPEIIEEGATGRLFRAGDAGALARAIAACFKERELTERMREEGRKRVEKKHSLEGMLDRIEEVYEGKLGEA